MIKRDAFLYLDPKGKKEQFAQCSTCIMWTGPMGNTCTIHGKMTIKGVDSCGLYIHGKNHTDMIGKEMPLVTPKESGLVRDTKVRCENCSHYDEKESECELYEHLNSHDPQMWELDEHVDPQGCCNAWEKIEKQMPVKNMAELRKRRDDYGD